MYNSMKENLMEYLAKFAQNGKVVREEDIKQFFEVTCSAIHWVHFCSVTSVHGPNIYKDTGSCLVPLPS